MNTLGLWLLSITVLIEANACSSQPTGPIHLSRIKAIVIQDNSASATLWYPKQINETKSEVISLLQGATLTTLSIPAQPKVTFYGYIGPVKLRIIENDGSKIQIYPASYLAKWKLDKTGNWSYHTVYIKHSIAVERNGHITYYNDLKLYDWLKIINGNIHLLL